MTNNQIKSQAIAAEKSQAEYAEYLQQYAVGTKWDGGRGVMVVVSANGQSRVMEMGGQNVTVTIDQLNSIAKQGGLKEIK